MGGGTDHGKSRFVVSGGEDLSDHVSMGADGYGEFGKMFGISVGKSPRDGCIRGKDAECLREFAG